MDEFSERFYQDLVAQFENLEDTNRDLVQEVEHVEYERDEAIDDLGRVTNELHEVRASVRETLTDLDALSEVPLKDLEAAIESLALGLRDVL